MATIFTIVFTVFFGAQYAITGFGFNLQPIFQMLAGYMFPGRPLGTYLPLNISVRIANSLHSKHVLHNLHLQRYPTGLVSAP
jgi:hypothetical protein